MSAVLFINPVAEAKTKSKAKAKTKTEKSKSEKPKYSPRDELMEMTPGSDQDIPATSPLDAQLAKEVPAAAVESIDLGYYYWQASPGRFAITPYAEAAYFKTKGTLITGAPGGFPYDIKGQIYRGGFEVEYGIFRYLSVGMGASYSGTYTDEDISTFTGFEDIPVFAKAILPLTNFTLHYGLKMSFSPADQISDGMGNKNAFSGGNTYGPYFGISRRLESGVAGVDVSYVYKDTRSTSRDQTGTPVANKINIEGGHLINVFGFYEKKFVTSTLGMAVGFSGESQFTYKTSTSTSTQDGESNFIGKVYYPFKSGSMDIIPAITGQTFLDDQLGNRLIDSKWQITARCDVRF